MTEANVILQNRIHSLRTAEGEVATALGRATIELYNAFTQASMAYSGSDSFDEERDAAMQMLASAGLSAFWSAEQAVHQIEFNASRADDEEVARPLREAGEDLKVRIAAVRAICDSLEGDAVNLRDTADRWEQFVTPLP